MLVKLRNMLLVSLSVLLLVSCSIDDVISEVLDSPEEIKSGENISIADLEETDYFRDGAIEHILEGELNRRGQAVGFHYDGLPSKKGKVIEGTETEPNELGVYEAKVEVSGVAKTSNGGKSTFFPLEWTSQDVIDAINEAYIERQFISGNTYEGLTSEGQAIRMYLDDKDLIISAFPVY